MSHHNTVPNMPNAGKLILSLRATGYDGLTALADIIDNAVDANANTIRVDIDTADNEPVITIADDGDGMDVHVLDEALKLGSLTERDHASDLGRFGMGLITASIAVCRRLEVITKAKDGEVLYSAQDIDQIVEEDGFVKVGPGPADAKAKEIFEKKVGAGSGTVVILSKVDRLGWKDLKVFSNKVLKHVAQTYRHFIFSGCRFIVNGKPVEAIDPLMGDNKGTQILSDEQYPVPLSARGMNETMRIRVALLPDFSDQDMKDLGIGQKTQGFYVLRNNREIAVGETLGVFTKHNDFNRMRMEIFVSGDIDEDMGVNFMKHRISPTEAIQQKIAEATIGQIRTIRNIAKAQQKSRPEAVVDHASAEGVINKKSKLLLKPKPTTEPKDVDSPTVKEPRKKDQTKNTRTGTSVPANVCEFQSAALGATNVLYEAEQYGKKTIVRWNTDHPFYELMMLEHGNKKISDAMDWMVYAMATAELRETDEDFHTMIANFKQVWAMNLATILK